MIDKIIKKYFDVNVAIPMQVEARTAYLKAAESEILVVILKEIIGDDSEIPNVMIAMEHEKQRTKLNELFNEKEK